MIQNTARQPSKSPTRPANAAPIRLPPMVIASQRAIATCRSPTGTASPMIASPTGKMPPVAMPQTTRASMRMAKLCASALRKETMMITAKHATIRRILPSMSASGPRIGCTQANGRAKAVDSSATLAASTARSPAMDGIRGSRARADSAVAKPMALTCVMSRAAGREGGIAGQIAKRAGPNSPRARERHAVRAADVAPTPFGSSAHCRSRRKAAPAAPGPARRRAAGI